ncbi:MAG: lipopolysaccharide heptosyltransferase II [Gemmatimonadales bacterium]
MTAPSATLVIQTAFLGDVVLTIPLLDALAERFGPVDVVTTPAAAPLIETHPAVRRVVRYDKRGADRGFRRFRQLIRGLRTEGYAQAYLPHRSWRSAALATLAGIPVRIGFRDSPARSTYTERRPRPTDVHESVRLLSLLDPTPAPRPFRLALTDQDRGRAAAWLAAAGVPTPFVALAPGSIWGTKRWPYYAELTQKLDIAVVAIGGPDDAPHGAAITAAAPGRAFNAAGALSLRESAALIERAALLVTNDSAPLHLATGVGTPVVAIFGPTVPAFGFGPLGADDAVVEHHAMPCRPCSAHGPQVCPLKHHRCMIELGPELVVREVQRILTLRGAGR